MSYRFPGIRGDCAKFMKAAEADAYIKSLSPGNGCIALAKEACVNMCVMFGVRDEDRVILGENTARLVEHIHEGWLRGEWKPSVGSSAALVGAIAIEVCGGRKPWPAERDKVANEIIRRMADHLEGKNKGQFHRPFAKQDPKAANALRLLDQIETEKDGEVR